MTGNRLTTILGLATLAVVSGALYLVFIWVPTEKEMGIVQRIFYFHMPSAWVAFLAFFVTFVGGIAYLKTRSRQWDIIASSSAEIGLMFCTITIITGSIWAKPIWGTWRTWDPRLTSALILWLMYASYFLLRSAVTEPSRAATLSAVVGIVGFVDVPIVFMSIRWWRTIHPVVIEGTDMHLEGRMVVTLMTGLLAFTLLYAFFMTLRTRLERLGDEVEALRHTWEEGYLEQVPEREVIGTVKFNEPEQRERGTSTKPANEKQ